MPTALPTEVDGRALFGRQGRPERLERVVEPGLGRPDGDVEGIGQLARSEADVEGQNQDGSLGRRQATKSRSSWSRSASSFARSSSAGSLGRTVFSVRHRRRWRPISAQERTTIRWSQASNRSTSRNVGRSRQARTSASWVHPARDRRRAGSVERWRRVDRRHRRPGQRRPHGLRFAPGRRGPPATPRSLPWATDLVALHPTAERNLRRFILRHQDAPGVAQRRAERGPEAFPD